jgi:hypothetical protein
MSTSICLSLDRSLGAFVAERAELNDVTAAEYVRGLITLKMDELGVERVASKKGPRPKRIVTKL